MRHSVAREPATIDAGIGYVRSIKTHPILAGRPRVRCANLRTLLPRSGWGPEHTIFISWPCSRTAHNKNAPRNDRNLCVPAVASQQNPTTKNSHLTPLGPTLCVYPTPASSATAPVGSLLHRVRQLDKVRSQHAPRAPSDPLRAATAAACPLQGYHGGGSAGDRIRRGVAISPDRRCRRRRLVAAGAAAVISGLTPAAKGYFPPSRREPVSTRRHPSLPQLPQEQPGTRGGHVSCRSFNGIIIVVAAAAAAETVTAPS